MTGDSSVRVLQKCRCGDSLCGACGQHMQDHEVLAGQGDDLEVVCCPTPHEDKRPGFDIYRIDDLLIVEIEVRI